MLQKANLRCLRFLLLNVSRFDFLVSSFLISFFREDQKVPFGL